MNLTSRWGTPWASPLIFTYILGQVQGKVFYFSDIEIKNGIVIHAENVKYWILL